MTVHTRHALRHAIDAERVEAAIAAAERRTSGEIRVSASTFFWGSVRRTAEAAFEWLGMTATRDRNAILFFIVPSRRTFVILGDRGIHARVGQEFWNDLAAALSARFRKDEFTAGLVEAIEAAGQRLAEYFPYDAATDRNELPDEVDFRD